MLEQAFDIDYNAIQEEYAALEITHLLGLPYEVQLQIIQKLIPDPEFMSYFLNYAATARLPRRLIMDFAIWMEVAHYWLKPENLSRLSIKTIAKTLHMIAQAGREHQLDLIDPKFEHMYKTNGLALVAAARSDDLHSTKVFLKKLSTTKYPYYLGEALKSVADSGSHDVAKHLLVDLSQKNPQGRDSQVRESFEKALANQNCSVLEAIVKNRFYKLASGLLDQALLLAGNQNAPSLVKAILENRLNEVSFLAKWAVKSTPGFSATGLSLDALFANYSWLLRTPISMMYTYQNPVLAITNQEEVDTDLITDLLEQLSLDETQQDPGVSHKPKKP